MTLYTKQQTIMLLHAWGYSEGTLPTKHNPTTFAHIGVHSTSDDVNTRARITFEGVNGSKHRLYGIEFIR